MKNIMICLLCTIGLTLHAQTWFDNSCKNIDESIAPEEFKTLEERNVLKIIVNQAGDIEINDELKPNMSEIGFKELVLDFVTNPNNNKEKADRPEKVVIQLKSFQKDPKKTESLKAYVYDVYLYLWDLESDAKYSSTYVNLNCKKREKIFNNFPLKIIGGLEKKQKTDNIRKGIGVPEFGGDAVKN